MMFQFLSEKDKIESKSKIKKQTSSESPTKKSMVIATDESDSESNSLSNPKVLEFKSGLLTCFKMIKSRQGKITADEIDARVDDWYHS